MSNQTNRSSKKSNFIVSVNLKQAAYLLKGARCPLWLTLFAFGVGVIVLLSVLAAAFNTNDTGLVLGLFNGRSLLRPDLLLLVGLAVFAPLLAGCQMIAVKRARGESIHTYSGFAYFSEWASLASIMVVIEGSILLLNALLIKIMDVFLPALSHPVTSSAIGQHSANLATAWSAQTTLLISLEFLVLTIVALWIRCLFLFAVPLFLEHKVSVWRALQGSFLLAWPHITRLLHLMLLLTFGFNALILVLVGLFNVIGLVLAIIATIWFIPFLFLNMGVAYHRLVTSPAELRAAVAAANASS